MEFVLFAFFFLFGTHKEMILYRKFYINLNWVGYFEKLISEIIRICFGGGVCKFEKNIKSSLNFVEIPFTIELIFKDVFWV